ncbi:MAG TPA: hypothetical protein PLS49_00040 [Candidatus Woesebacteria bacterium]|nr:hypothetical protein [Candidatus Woesebacteria bacterium]
MVYLSYVIQKVTAPPDLYQLVMSHRMFIGLFSVFMTIILTMRFKWIGIWFVLIFELTKYYLFGNLFLAESLVAYLLVYMVGIAWLKLNKSEDLSRLDIIGVAICTWMIAFLREPFIPVAGLLSIYIFFDKQYIKTKIITIVGMIISALWMINTVIFEDYFFNMFVLNFGGYIQEELGSKGVVGVGGLKIIFYPLYIFIGGLSTDFRLILLFLSCIFTISIGFILVKRKYVLTLAIFSVLALANIRFRDPGSEFYAGFHMLPWYAVYVLITLFLVGYLRKTTKLKWYMYLVGIMICGVILVAIKSPYSTIKRDVDRYEEFSTNYGRFYVNGEVINILSDSDDKVFVDDWDTLVYWQANLDSSYTYAMYFPVMNSVEKFSKERENMFMNTPPEFYYTDCGQNKERSPLPVQIRDQYHRLFFDNEPTCLYVLKTKAETISEKQWERVREFGFYVPGQR